MTDNLFDQLRALEIPPLPDDFDDRLHRQLNDWLLISHLLEFAGRALPVACGHFARAMLATAICSLTGKFTPIDSKGENDEE